MPSPQLEDGYTRIANQILEALARTRIPGEARQVLDAILRKTYGFGKTQDWISLSQFCEMTTMRKVAVCKALKKLAGMNIITKKGNGATVSYGLMKDFGLWRPLPKKVIVTKKGNFVTKKGNPSLPNLDTTKETITKEKDTTSAENPRAKKLPPKKPEKPKINGWKVWIDANREVGRSDPLPVPKDLGSAKRLSALFDSEEDLLRVMVAYLNDKDSWLANSGHSISLLQGRINKYAGAKRPQTEDDDAELVRLYGPRR